MKCLCNSSLISQYCFINDSSIHIDEYKQNKSIYSTKDLKCSNGHLLTFVNGKIKKPHFRHISSNDLDKTSPMTEWHAEWQGNFSI